MSITRRVIAVLRALKSGVSGCLGLIRVESYASRRGNIVESMWERIGRKDVEMGQGHLPTQTRAYPRLQQSYPRETGVGMRRGVGVNTK